MGDYTVNTLFSGLTFYTAIFSISVYWFHIELRCKFFALVVATIAATFLSAAAHFYLYYQEITHASNEVASVELELKELDHKIINAVVSATEREKRKLKNLRKRRECSMQASKLFSLKYYLILLAAIVATLIFASSFQFGVYQVLCSKFLHFQIFIVVLNY